MSNTKWTQEAIFMYIHTHMCVSVMIKEEKAIHLRGSGRDVGGVGEEGGVKDTDTVLMYEILNRNKFKEY